MLNLALLNLALVALVLQGSALQQTEPRLDATSEESLERTMKQAAEALPSKDRGKLEEALGILIGGSMDKHPNESPEASLRALLHGKTARQVISEAEKLVRRLIDAESRRKLTTTSRALPPGTPVPGDALACEALVSTTIGPSRASAADLLQVSDASFKKPQLEQKRLFAERLIEGTSSLGTDTLAIEVRGQDLHFVTRASVEAGSAFGPPFRIIKNDATALAAVDLQEGPLGFTLSSFLLNKSNGFAVWTKSRPSLLIQVEPDTQAHYLRCH